MNAVKIIFLTFLLTGCAGSLSKEPLAEKPDTLNDLACGGIQGMQECFTKTGWLVYIRSHACLISEFYSVQSNIPENISPEERREFKQKLNKIQDQYTVEAEECEAENKKEYGNCKIEALSRVGAKIFQC